MLCVAVVDAGEAGAVKSPRDSGRAGEIPTWRALPLALYNRCQAGSANPPRDAISYPCMFYILFMRLHGSSLQNLWGRESDSRCRSRRLLPALQRNHAALCCSFKVCRSDGVITKKKQKNTTYLHDPGKVSQSELSSFQAWIFVVVVG